MVFGGGGILKKKEGKKNSSIYAKTIKRENYKMNAHPHVQQNSIHSAQ